MIIRREEKEDIRVVEELIRDAFWNVYGPGATEHYVAHRLRSHKDFVKELNMVAEVDGKIAGSIMYTEARLTCEDGRSGKCLSFGPLAIHPEYQRKGIGKALIETTFASAKEMGYECVVIFGNPGNYVSRGFLSCRRVNVCTEEGIFPTAMLVKPLADDVFDGKRWTYAESDAYEFNPEEAEAYDRLFPFKEKKVLPSQEEFYIYSHSRIFDDTEQQEGEFI